jgi:hypothetical protein
MLTELFNQIFSACMDVLPMAAELWDILYISSAIKLQPGNWMTKYKKESWIKIFQAVFRLLRSYSINEIGTQL